MEAAEATEDRRPSNLPPISTRHGFSEGDRVSMPIYTRKGDDQKTICGVVKYIDITSGEKGSKGLWCSPTTTTAITHSILKSHDASEISVEDRRIPAIESAIAVHEFQAAGGSQTPPTTGSKLVLFTVERQEHLCRNTTRISGENDFTSVATTHHRRSSRKKITSHPRTTHRDLDHRTGAWEAASRRSHRQAQVVRETNDFLRAWSSRLIDE